MIDYMTIPEMQAKMRSLEAQIDRLTLDLEMERRAREKAESDRARYWGALWEIRQYEGRVCEQYSFDECQHVGCDSSYRAWSIADAALSKQASTP